MIAVTSLERCQEELHRQAYSFITGDMFVISDELRDFQAALWECWSDLEADNYLKGEHQFRFRRYGRFLLHPDRNLELLPHAPFLQSPKNNPYAGGIAREFSALTASASQNQFLKELIHCDFSMLPITTAERNQAWEIDVHQYRVVGNATHAGFATPEGIHHDGFDYFAVHLIGRENAAGAISTIYNNDKEPIASNTLMQPMDSILVQDPRVMHAVSPLLPSNPSLPTIRDVLIINFISEPRK